MMFEEIGGMVGQEVCEVVGELRVFSLYAHINRSTVICISHTPLLKVFIQTIFRSMIPRGVRVWLFRSSSLKFVSIYFLIAIMF